MKYQDHALFMNALFKRFGQGNATLKIHYYDQKRLKSHLKIL